MQTTTQYLIHFGQEIINFLKQYALAEADGTYTMKDAQNLADVAFLLCAGAAPDMPTSSYDSGAYGLGEEMVRAQHDRIMARLRECQEENVQCKAENFIARAIEAILAITPESDRPVSQLLVEMLETIPDAQPLVVLRVTDTVQLLKHRGIF